MDAERAAAVEALRGRLQRLGGLPARALPGGEANPGGGGERGGGGGGGGMRGTAGAASAGAPLVAGPAPRLTHASAPDPGALGFAAELTAAGSAWVRRVSVDLGPFLARAGGAAPVTSRDLVRLAYGIGRGQPEPSFGAGDCAVLDIESLGLRGSGVVAFLVGVGVPRGKRLDIDQLLLADPGMEAAMLLALLARLRRRRLVVTYNGRGFDLPVLRGRCIVNRLGGEHLEELLHCDLLVPVRRLFRDRLGVCSLRQTELCLLGFERQGDVPGAEAPARYRQWLHRGAAGALDGVVLHNQLDLCATMVLAARLVEHVDGRLVEPTHPADRFRLGVHLERLGVEGAAEGHYRAALAGRHPPWSRQAAHRLARRLRRGAVAEREEAAALLAALWGEDPLDLRAARALCILEERAGRLERALEVAERALEVSARLGEWRLRRLRGAPPGGWGTDWERRRARLGLRLRSRPATGLLPIAETA